VARRLLLRAGVGEHLLTTKLLILSGSGSRPTNNALSMLTGSLAVQPLVDFHRSRHYSARTVYLSEQHLGDVDRIADAWQLIEPRRLSRSAVVRRAVDFLYAAVEADPAKFMLENE
jgi:hypothetical protein